MRISDWSSDVCSSDLRDNLRFGNDYGRFASCRIISGSGLNFLYSPADPLCATPGAGPLTIGGASGASGTDILAAFNLLAGLHDRGSINDHYYQHDPNWALFTTNIYYVTDTIDYPFALRSTNDTTHFPPDYTTHNHQYTTHPKL